MRAAPAWCTGDVRTPGGRGASADAEPGCRRGARVSVRLYASGAGVVGVLGISSGVPGGTPMGSPGAGASAGDVGGMPIGSAGGVWFGSGGRAGVGFGSPGVGVVGGGFGSGVSVIRLSLFEDKPGSGHAVPRFAAAHRTAPSVRPCDGIRGEPPPATPAPGHDLGRRTRRRPDRGKRAGLENSSKSGAAIFQNLRRRPCSARPHAIVMVAGRKKCDLQLIGIPFVSQFLVAFCLDPRSEGADGGRVFSPYRT